MSFTDLMIDAGFDDEQEYMNYLESEALDYYDEYYDCCGYEDNYEEY